MALGIDTKTDPKQLQIGRFLSLNNTIFQKGGLLQKRNGFGQITQLPNTDSTFLTTFNGNLTAISDEINAYTQGTARWVTKGSITPLEVRTLPIVRSSFSETQSDSVTAGDNLVCTAYTSNGQFLYTVTDINTTQSIVAPTLIPPTTGTVTGAAKVFLMTNYFLIVFPVLIGGTNHLQLLAIPTGNPTAPLPTLDITAQYSPSGRYAFDGVVANNTLYLAWNGSDLGGAIRMQFITSTFLFSTVKVISGFSADMMSVTADITTPTLNIYVAFVDSVPNGYVFAVDHILATLFGPSPITTGIPIANITQAAANGLDEIFYEQINAYGYDPAIPTNFIQQINVTQAGVITGVGIVSLSVGLAAKAFIYNGTTYLFTTYHSPNQDTYFLMDNHGNIISKLAYSNGGGYLTKGLPNFTLNGTTITLSYLFKDLIEAVNKSQGLVAPNGVYAQTGINLVKFNFDANFIVAEIGNNLHLSGGILWAYDGQKPVEQNFNVYPDSIELTPSTTGGTMTAQQYFYQVIYEWTDLQGNIHRSAPSIPVTVTTTGATSSVVVHIPTLRLSYKTKVKINIYRWSTGQQNYYQVTSVATPLINDPTVNDVAYTDTLPDSAIIGNSLIYTTGGVVENIGPPPTSTMTLFKSRLFLVDAEDRNLLWYSKQVIETTPVEMSDLFTIFIAPTISAQGSTGEITALAALDDKLIVFKSNAIYYLTGNGPDNLGANNDFSDPIFITSTVGCIDQNSIVFMPNGLMFQSDKGIWLLGRDMSTNYIGAQVEKYNSNIVLSSLNIPATNQVRFTLDNGITLMYDYFYNQWGTFVNIPGVSSTLYQQMHTYLDRFGRVFQETPGLYLDGSNPVLMSFTTGWANIAGLQGFERAYYFLLLGSYITPHKLQIQIAYDYEDSIFQSSIINPDNFNPVYGSDSLYGGSSPFGGPSSIEQWRVFLQRQKCQSFQITMNEIYDPTFGVAAGAGFTLSGLDLVIGVKKGYTTLRPSNSVG